MTTRGLADAVLPLVRTRADVHRWGAANEHGRQLHAAVEILQAAIPTADPFDAYAVTHKALASAVTIIARADDSSGIIGDACRRLLDLHPNAAAADQGRRAALPDRRTPAGDDAHAGCWERQGRRGRHLRRRSTPDAPPSASTSPGV